MKRTTIFIDEPLERDLKARAERERRPMAELVREAVREYMAHDSAAAPLPRFVGVGRSGRTDTAERHEELLFQSEPDEPEPPPTRPKSSARRR